MKEGWICPRCNRVNAPFMPYCDCYKNISIANRVCTNGMHEWECIGVSTAGSTYRCKVCHEIKNESYEPDRNGVRISSNFNKGGAE